MGLYVYECSAMQNARIEAAGSAIQRSYICIGAHIFDPRTGKSTMRSVHTHNNQTANNGTGDME